jgi:ribose-phosphate pyrophosphokinase
MKVIVPGSASLELAKKVSNKTGISLLDVEKRLFPDGEIYVRLKNDVRGKEAIVIQSTHYPQNDNLMELFFLVSALKDNGAKKIRVIIPYYGYGRQDRIFLAGENVSAKTVAKILKTLGAKEIITLDPHFYRRIGIYSYGGVKIKCISAVNTLVDEVVKREKMKNPFVIGPDLEAGEMSDRAAEHLKSTSEAIYKTRIGDREVQMKGVIDVEGRDVILLDDIVSTGKTMIKATQHMRGKAKKIVVACVHGVFAEGALQKIKKAGAVSVYACDTLPNKATIISVADDIANVI